MIKYLQSACGELLQLSGGEMIKLFSRSEYWYPRASWNLPLYKCVLCVRYQHLVWVHDITRWILKIKPLLGAGFMKNLLQSFFFPELLILHCQFAAGHLPFSISLLSSHFSLLWDTRQSKTKHPGSVKKRWEHLKNSPKNSKPLRLKRKKELSL